MGPTLSTSRLLLREWSIEDADAAYEMYGDPEVTRFLGNGQIVPDVAAQKVWLAEKIEHYRNPKLGGLGVWAAVERDTKQVVGTILLKPLPPMNLQIEIGWHLVRRAWGRGYATEAARVVLHYGFVELQLDRILAVIKPGNVRSAAVAHRIGMHWLEKSDRFYNGEELDVFVMEQESFSQSN